MSDKRNLVLALIGLVLLASIGTSFMLPHLFVKGADGTKLFGADLLNLFLFHNCSAADEHYYSATWEMCGDPFQRNMVYPPVLYRSFFWLSFLSFPVALAVWTLVIIFSFLLAGFILLMALQKESLSVRPLYFWVTWLLLGMQVPLLFAIERGNNDIYVLLLFSSGLYLAQKDNWMGVGALLALVTSYKLYPVFLVFIVVLAAFNAKKAKPLLLSLATSGLVLFVLFLGEHLYYLHKVLPFWAAKKSGEAWAFDHVILNMNKVLPTLGTGMCLVLLATGVGLALRIRSQLIIWCYALAICTFFQKVSFDYNLISVFPLLLVLVSLGLKKKASKHSFYALWLLLCGVLVFFTARYFGALYAGVPKYVAIWGWLVFVGIYLGVCLPASRDSKLSDGRVSESMARA